MKKNIVLLPGDGVGPEIIAQARVVLDAVSRKFHHDFTYESGLIGACAIEAAGDPYPPETHKLCERADAVLFGAIGHPKYDNDPAAKVRPEQGLLKMRKSLGLYANVRPIHTFKPLLDASPLKREIIEGVDFIVVRELTGGIYFGEPRGRSDDGARAFDTCVYTKEEVSRVTRFAFDLAAKRGRKVTVVDKANVLETSRLWRETVQEYARANNNIAVEYMFVDNAAMQIIRRPADFDVLLTENMFGDILTDEASVITGSIGMLPSASIGKQTAIYEPIHGSYPQAAGLNIANPVGAILSAAMMLEYSFGLKAERDVVYAAVHAAIENGHGTKDIRKQNPESTEAFGAAIASHIV